MSTKYSFPNQLQKQLNAASYEMRTSESGKLFACFYDDKGEPISEHLAYLNFSEKTKSTYHNCFTEPSRSLRRNEDFLKNFTFDPKEVMKMVNTSCADYTRDDEPYGTTKTGNNKFKVYYKAGDETLAIGTVIELKNRHSVIYATDYAYATNYKKIDKAIDN